MVKAPVYYAADFSRVLKMLLQGVCNMTPPFFYIEAVVPVCMSNS